MTNIQGDHDDLLEEFNFDADDDTSLSRATPNNLPLSCDVMSVASPSSSESDVGFHFHDAHDDLQCPSPLPLN